MLLPDGSSREWTKADLPLRDDIGYDNKDTIAMAQYIRECVDKEILEELKQL